MSSYIVSLEGNSPPASLPAENAIPSTDLGVEEEDIPLLGYLECWNAFWEGCFWGVGHLHRALAVRLAIKAYIGRKES